MCRLEKMRNIKNAQQCVPIGKKLTEIKNAQQCGHWKIIEKK